MNVCDLTRRLVDIESVTGNEEQVGRFLAAHLGELAARTNGSVEVMDVEPRRSNVFACWGDPVVTLSTHMDTVPPFFPSSEDVENVAGRGTCDAKGIIAAMVCAVEGLLAEGVRDIGLLFVVGEERNSAGAYAAARTPRGSKFLINGEPTGNTLALGSKGALRFEVQARGRMAHSAYPELGASAIEKLLDALQTLRGMPLLSDPVLGRSTLNIGTIAGGRAPNVIADRAQAEVLVRLVDDGAATRDAIHRLLGGGVEIHDILCTPAVHLGSLPGFETTVVAYTTDIPAFGGAWGRPYLAGPGSIHVAHTTEERVARRELEDAVLMYQRMIKQLLRA